MVAVTQNILSPASEMAYNYSKLPIYHHGFLFFSQTGSTPLYMACQQGQSDVVNILLANGADVNLTGFQVKSVMPTDHHYCWSLTKLICHHSFREGDQLMLPDSMDTLMLSVYWRREDISHFTLFIYTCS